MTAAMPSSGAVRDPIAAAARLMWISMPGSEIDAETDALLRAGVGGVVIFSRNISGAGGLRDLTAGLRRRASGPLRIAIDHEGGHVARIGAPLTRFPSQMAIAATGAEDLAEQAAQAAGRELVSIGIDVVLAPVVDVAADGRNASVGARSFGSDPARVARFAAATVRGFHAAGIACTAKHFPGHGRTPVDSHLALPVVSGGADELRRVDLPPFRAAIEAGVELIMASHVAVEGLTQGLPSSLSPQVMVDLLRTELRFGGLVITDAMDMRALADGHAVPAASARAIASGADAVMPQTEQRQTIEAMEEAIRDGSLPEARVSSALARGHALDRDLARRSDRRAAVWAVPNAEHGALALQIAQRSLTLLSAGTLLPIPRSASVTVIEFPSRRPSPVEERLDGTLSLGDALRAHVPRTAAHAVAEGERDAAADTAVVEAARHAEIVILATRDAYMWPQDRALIEKVTATRVPTILVAMRNPYDLEVMPRTDERIAAYADVPVTLRALADALIGKAPRAGSVAWPGRLPVSAAAPAEQHA